MKHPAPCILLIGILVTALFAAGCGQEPAIEGEAEASSNQVKVDEIPMAGSFGPEEIVAAYEASAKSLGFRDESDRSTGVYLYFDEATELLYRLTVHGIERDLLPEVGAVSSRTNDDGFLVIESTIYADERIWVEAASALSAEQADRGTATQNRIAEIQEAFVKALQEQPNR